MDVFYISDRFVNIKTTTEHIHYAGIIHYTD